MRQTPARTSLRSGRLCTSFVSGQRAFHRESAAETMTAIAREDPAPLAGLASLPPSVERIIWRCLEKDSAARFQSCQDLAFALESATVDSGSGSGLAQMRSIAAGPPIASDVGGVGVVLGAAVVAFFSGFLPLRRLASRATTSICRQAPRWSRLRWRSRPTAQVRDSVARLYLDAARIASRVR